MLTDVGELREAIAYHRRAVALAPDNLEVHRALALALLAAGDFEEGWREYDWRQRRRYPQPAWDGGPLAGRSILVYQEDGLGDTLQFARYVPLVAASGGRVILECAAPLARLLQRLAGVERVVVAGDPLPAFDTHAALMSLPACVGTTRDTIPRAVPYLAADPRLVESWRARLGRADALSVGLVWRGNPCHPNDSNRSMRRADLAPLGRVPGVHLYGLQVGPAGASVDGNLGPQLNNFDDTAAVVSVLDLVITVDTSVAHLAGALGRPVWVLLSSPHDWRWHLEHETSPWYPSMRLYRQERPGDWGPVVERVAVELARLAALHERTGAGAGVA